MRNQKVEIKIGDPDTVLYHRLPVALYEKIAAFINARRYASRTSAMNDLMTIGLTVVNNMDKIQDPELVSELKAQIQEGDLVHYIQSLNPSQIQVLWSIVDTEIKDRDKSWRSRLGKK
jgi:hypothetical protein